MWDYWQKPEDYAGRDFVLITFEPEYLDRARFESRFARITDVKRVQVMKSGRVAGQFFYRIGYAYQPPRRRCRESRRRLGGSGMKRAGRRTVASHIFACHAHSGSSARRMCRASPTCAAMGRTSAMSIPGHVL